MNLNTLRHIKLLRGGEIRAWALRQSSYVSLYDEHQEVIEWHDDYVSVLDIPVVFVGPGQPEGVIV